MDKYKSNRTGNNRNASGLTVPLKLFGTTGTAGGFLFTKNQLFVCLTHKQPFFHCSRRA